MWAYRDYGEGIREVIREGVDRPTAVRMLIEIGHKKWNLQQSLRFLQEGKLSVWKAAEMSGMNLWDFLNVLRKENIPWVEFDPKEMLQSTNLIL